MAWHARFALLRRSSTWRSHVEERRDMTPRRRQKASERELTRRPLHVALHRRHHPFMTAATRAVGGSDRTEWSPSLGTVRPRRAAMREPPHSPIAREIALTRGVRNEFNVILN